MINHKNVALAALALLGIAGQEVSPAAPPDDVLSLPPQCHAEGFRQDAFLDWDTMSFEQQTPQQHTRFVWKYDVVCMAPNIHLTTDIYTNGGDVYLFGDSVTIDAHIDTRVYRP